MPKYRAEFQEIVTYVVEFEAPHEINEDAENDDWFDVLDQCNPSWITSPDTLFEVNDRGLIALTEIEEFSTKPDRPSEYIAKELASDARLAPRVESPFLKFARAMVSGAGSCRKATNGKRSCFVRSRWPLFKRRDPLEPRRRKCRWRKAVA